SHGSQDQRIRKKGPSENESKENSWYPMKTRYNARYVEFREFGTIAMKGCKDSS
ncbi:hypothetical protein HAX54_033171, partial [Datura stramonium]|nr:hypothetical protein [Datura stramonium]